MEIDLSSTFGLPGWSYRDVLKHNVQRIMAHYRDVPVNSDSIAMLYRTVDNLVEQLRFRAKGALPDAVVSVTQDYSVTDGVILKVLLLVGTEMVDLLT
jgi:hypothetical protein